MNIDYKLVELFLKTVFREIYNGSWFLVPRNDIRYDNKKVNYKQALLDLGIVKSKEVADYLLLLKAHDCFNISRDHDKRCDYNDDIYEFITQVNGIKTYIKLTLNEKGAVCISFHKSNTKR